MTNWHPCQSIWDTLPQGQCKRKFPLWWAGPCLLQKGLNSILISPFSQLWLATRKTVQQGRLIKWWTSKGVCQLLLWTKQLSDGPEGGKGSYTCYNMGSPHDDKGMQKGGSLSFKQAAKQQVYCSDCIGHLQNHNLACCSPLLWCFLLELTSLSNKNAHVLVLKCRYTLQWSGKFRNFWCLGPSHEIFT